MKSRSTIIIGIIVAVLAFWGVGKYNAIATSQENVERAWGDVETQYQRRSDLIPNLVNTVKGYAQHEQSTLEAVVAARTKATQVTIDPSNATPEQIAEYQKAQGELGQALGRLIAITENYPDLKASANFQELMSQLEGTENRISVARSKFNEEAQGFNKLIVAFPGNLVAKFCGFEKKNYFEAEAGAKTAPKVEF